MTNLNTFIDEQKKTEEDLNDAFGRWAEERAIPLTIRTTKHEGYSQRAIEVNPSFVQALKQMDTKMEPSLEELEQLLEQDYYGVKDIHLFCEDGLFTIEADVMREDSSFSLQLNLNQLLAHSWLVVDGDSWTMSCTRCKRMVYLEENDDWNSGMEERCMGY